MQGYHFPRKLAGGPLQASCLPHLHVAGLPLESLLSFYEVACCVLRVAFLPVAVFDCACVNVYAAVL